MIGVSGGPASAGVGASSPQPALDTTVTAVVATVSAVVTAVTARATGTISLRAFTLGFCTRPA